MAMSKMMVASLWIVASLAGLAVAVVGGWVLYMRSIDQPSYELVVKVGNIEVRDYGPMTVAEVTRQGDRDSAVRAGFRPLARYIFAKDRPGDKIAMTAPVTQQPAEGSADDTVWKVQFIMPEGMAQDTLPKPADADVRLLTIDPTRRAAIRFSGRADDALMQANETRLRDWLNDKGYSTSGPAIYAYYDDPFTPGMFRRNEVLFEVQR
jgi:hypothetical protein